VTYIKYILFKSAHSAIATNQHLDNFFFGKLLNVIEIVRFTQYFKNVKFVGRGTVLASRYSTPLM